MSVIAAILGFVEAGFNLFQPIIQIQQLVFSRRIELSIFDLIKMMFSGANRLNNMGFDWNAFFEALMRNFQYASLAECTLLAVFITPVIALIGAHQAISRKGGAGLFGFCAAVCGANCLFVNNGISQLPYELREIAKASLPSQVFLLWAGIYGAAMLCALLINNELIMSELKKRDNIYF